MATSPNNSKETTDDLSAIKRKLAWRMGFAGLMIIALLGALALFDYLSAPREPEAAAPQFTEPVPVPKKVVTQPLAPVEPVPNTVKEEIKVAAPEATATPVDKSALALEPPSRPEVTAQPTLPKATAPAAKPPVLPAATVSASPATKSPDMRSTPPAAVPTPREQPPVATQLQLPPPAPLRLFSGFALQAGVFTDPRRAEELHAKLTLEGIPSTIEARVQVGPFKSKEEAEAARGKMKALGIDAVMILPKTAKR
jgi:DedD protein